MANARVRELQNLNKALVERDGLKASFHAPESFVANVVGTCEVKVATRLKGLVNLVKAGHEVSTAQFDLLTLCIDGARVGSFSELEKHAKGVAL